MSALELLRLAGGLRVALDPMPGLMTAAVSVWQRVGARWEAPAQNGLAHLFEHMAFKGAGGRDARAFAEAIEAVGGHLNAATGYEYTGYFARMMGEHAPFALELIADILFAPHWEQAEFAKELGVVAQERGEAFDLPTDRVFELHQAALFPEQPLGRPILGEAATLDALSVRDLERFRDEHLTPDRLVISVAGGFDREAILAAVERRFLALQTLALRQHEPARPQQGFAYEVRRTEQAQLVLSWPAPAASDDAARAAHLLAEIYGGGMSSRLFQRVREERGLAYSIYASLDAYDDAGRLLVSAASGAKDSAEVAAVAFAELEALAAHGPTEAELARAKAVSIAGLFMSAEAPSARAEARAMQVFLRDRLLSFEELRAMISSVTADDVRRLAETALKGPVCMAFVGPKADVAALKRFQER